MKKTLAFLLAIIMVLCLSVTAFAFTAQLSAQKLSVNGVIYACEKYNIDDYNYFKLRDLAQLLNGTGSQFDVGYDEENKLVTITTNHAYTTPNGHELELGSDKSSTAQVSAQTIMIDGVVRTDLTVYNIGDSNFFKLREMGDALGFNVDYDSVTNTAIVTSKGYSSAVTSELTAEQIYAKCSPAVFYIEVADKNNVAYASGSGFFIASDGTAVTNYHVIDGAYSATITLSSTKAQYKVAGVYDYNEDEDWAILKIEGSGFQYLEIGDTSTVAGGAKCYAIGSPQGLQNTISDGIISNPAQNIGGMSYIQTTAAISHGSSGGALINKYGKVIGITAAGYEDGENLGFAIPISIIAGYSHSQYTALSELFPGTSSDYSYSLSAQDAYLYLIAFVYVYYNEKYENYIYYAETEATSTGSIKRSIYYDTENDTIGVQRTELYNNEYYITTLILNCDSLYHTVGYSFYANPYSTNPDFLAYSFLYAPSFYGNNLEFTGVDVNTGYNVSLNESLASSDLHDCLYFTDYVFYRYLYDYGDFGVYLFGFTDYNQY